MTRTQILTHLADQGVLGARACLDGHGSRIVVTTPGQVPEAFVGVVDMPFFTSFWTFVDGRRRIEWLPAEIEAEAA